MITYLKNKLNAYREARDKKGYFYSLDKKLYHYIYLSPESLRKRKPLGVASQNLSPLAMYDFTVDIILRSYKVEYIHQIRGSLISIYKDDVLVVQWVDQTKQYAGWIGLNDIKNDLTALELKELNLLLDEYIEGEIEC